MKLTHYLRTEQHYSDAPLGTRVAPYDSEPGVWPEPEWWPSFYERVTEDRHGRSWALGAGGSMADPVHRSSAMAETSRRIIRWGYGPVETADLLAGLDTDQQEHAPTVAILGGGQ